MTIPSRQPGDPTALSDRDESNGSIETLLASGLEELEIRVPGDAADAMLRFIRLLEKWNQAYNLTAVRELREMVPRHLLDSASAQSYLRGMSIVDVGSGAGLPGIPLAIIDRSREFVLIDSNGKKVRFMRHAIGELRLGNIKLEQVRAEEFVQPDPFDTVISRALGSLAGFVRRCGHLAGQGGRLVAMKGRNPEKELADLPSEWRATAIDRVEVPHLDATRHIVVLERTVL